MTINYGRKDRKKYQSKETLRIIPAIRIIINKIFLKPVPKYDRYFNIGKSAGCSRSKVLCKYWTYTLREIEGRKSGFIVHRKTITLRSYKCWLIGKIMMENGRNYRVISKY